MTAPPVPPRRGTGGRRRRRRAREHDSPPRSLDQVLRTAGAATGQVGVAVLRRILTAEEPYSALGRTADHASAPQHAWRMALESHLLHDALFRGRVDDRPGHPGAGRGAVRDRERAGGRTGRRAATGGLPGRAALVIGADETVGGWIAGAVRGA
ncbi:hypothetical protein [Streptomyces sp. NPDC056660]|uniref:hypothetical protein n=1 Tax=Streptomyces sp. NPDC056660 TaxID=3345897 RepID=UPI003674EA72